MYWQFCRELDMGNESSTGETPSVPAAAPALPSMVGETLTASGNPPIVQGPGQAPEHR